MTAIAELIALLEERIGLDAESIGTSAIERAVRQRVLACALADDRTYWEHVRSSEAELQELVESVVVPETWFFRDREALAALASLAAGAQARRADTTLHLLSIPCSTGEEPYSMTMALLDAGVGADHFQVDGVDISARALAAAQRAVYGRNSFRGADLEFRGRYFQPGPNGAYHLADWVRPCVRFRQGNLLNLDLPRPAGGYDFIFCRNVLIYFAPPAQGRALEALRDLSAPAGLVFVGPAETSLMVRHGYVSAKLPLAFAFRKAADTRGASPVETLAPTPTRPRAARRSALPPPVGTPAASAPAEIEAVPRPTVADVERLADQGQLEDAAAACEALLREHGADARVYYLAGVVHGALGHRARAIELYRKALYIDPLHADALAHLAYLLDMQGDTAGAEIVRDRARRARERRQG